MTDRYSFVCFCCFILFLTLQLRLQGFLVSVSFFLSFFKMGLMVSQRISFVVTEYTKKDCICVFRLLGFCFTLKLYKSVQAIGQ